MSAATPRVAVTGLGVISGLGVGADTVFRRLTNAESGIRPVTLFDTAGLRCSLAAEVSDLRPAEIALAGMRLSRTDALAVVAAREALTSARYEPAPFTLGLSLGGTTGSMFETEAELLLAGSTRAARTGARLVSDPISATIGALDREIARFKRTAFTCSACSSGAVAIVQAARWILAGEVDAALAGGADALCRMTFAGFHALGAMDSRPCRPFDVSRSGLTLGEGAAFLVLESEASASARGATVHAWLSGFAVGAEAHHVTHPEPSGVRAAQLMAQALSTAGLTPSQLDYVNAHGTATVQNDAMEALALRRVFADDVGRVRVSSSKAQLGHTLGAAGAIEAAITVLALRSGVLPPTVGLEEPADPELGHIRRSSVRSAPRRALSNSFGFGGMGAVLLFEAAELEPSRGAFLPRELVVSGVAAVGRELTVNADCAELVFGAPPPAPVPGDPIAALDADRSRRFDRTAAWVTQLARAAITTAGLPPEGVGLVVGSAFGTVGRSVAFLDRLAQKGLRQVPPAEFPHLLHSAGAGNASVYVGLNGPVLSVCCGAASGGAAAAAAQSLIALGLADGVLAGAVEAHDSEVTDTPGARDMPRSEGGALVLLESARSVEQRGAFALARWLLHVEDRGGGLASVQPPIHRERARVLLGVVDEGVGAELARSSWAGLPITELCSHVGFHEAVGAVAIAVGVAMVARDDGEVLIISGSGGGRYLTHVAGLGSGS